jgi:hypothetical protein
MQELQLNLVHQNFYCPVTGDSILSDDRYQPSSATVFTYLDEVGDFQDLAPEFEPLVDELCVLDDDHSLFERFKKRLNDDKIVCFSITTRGMAGGMEHLRIRIGINMNYVPAFSDS